MQRLRSRVPRFIRCNLLLVLQRQSTVVQPIKQAVAHEFVDRKLGAKAPIVPNLTLFQIDGELVIVEVPGAPHYFIRLIFFQPNREETIFRAVVSEDVGEGRRNHGAESEIGQRPHRVLSRRPAAEILPCHKDAGALKTRLVEDEAGVLISVRRKPPIVKQKLAKAGALNPLQKLFGNDLVGVDVNAVQRSHASAMCAKWFHRLSSRKPGIRIELCLLDSYQGMPSEAALSPVEGHTATTSLLTCAFRRAHHHRNFQSRMSVKCPATAAAAAIIGLTRWVRPPRPCRPSKFRLLVEAHRSPGCKISGFIPRHIEHPDSRHSNPASRKIRWRPSCSAARLIFCDPGTTIARTDWCTRWPLIIRAAA